MVQQILYHVFRSDKSKVQDIFYDLTLFYKFINQNDRILDDWYFQNVFTSRYWVHLTNYDWLTDDEMTCLHQGILNLILFLSYQYLDNKGKHIEKISQKAFRSLSSFSPQAEKTKKLRNNVLKALMMVEKKRQGSLSIVDNVEMNKTITWTLQNTMFNSGIQLHENENQR